MQMHAMADAWLYKKQRVVSNLLAFKIDSMLSLTFPYPYYLK